MNSLFCIRPRKQGSVWVFSCEERGIINEPFVSSFGEIIDNLLRVADLSASESFTAIFSENAFPDYHARLDLEKLEHGGAWYYDQMPNMNAGWLCPVLFEFFDEAPQSIFVRAEK